MERVAVLTGHLVPEPQTPAVTPALAAETEEEQGDESERYAHIEQLLAVKEIPSMRGCSLRAQMHTR